MDKRVKKETPFAIAKVVDVNYDALYRFVRNPDHKLWSDTLDGLCAYLGLELMALPERGRAARRRKRSEPRGPLRLAKFDPPPAVDSDNRLHLARPASRIVLHVDTGHLGGGHVQLVKFYADSARAKFS